MLFTHGSINYLEIDCSHYRIQRSLHVIAKFTVTMLGVHVIINNTSQPLCKQLTDHKLRDSNCKSRNLKQICRLYDIFITYTVEIASYHVTCLGLANSKR